MDESDVPDRPSPNRNKRTLSNKRRLEIELEGWNTREDIEITSDHHAFLREAGASDCLIAYLDSDTEEIEGGDNRIKREVRDDIFYGDLRLDADPEAYDPEGSRMFTKLWEGDLYGAYSEAGMEEVVLFESVFGEDRINSDRSDEDQPKIEDLDPGRFWICEYPLRNFEEDME